MSEFIKNGKQIVSKPKGLDYDLIPGKVYNLKYNDWDGYSYLEEDGSILLPEKIYQNDDDSVFIDRILDSFEQSSNNNVGVMLTGLKGAGKSLTAKQLAVKSEMPIFVVSVDYPATKLKDFFTVFHTPVCVIFDEIDKNERHWCGEAMLGFLDGIQSTAKKLVICTCNETCDLCEYMIDRCSRIKFFKEYGGVNKSTIEMIIKDYLGKEDTELATFIDTQIKVKSYDNILTYIKDVAKYPNIDKYKLITDLNINIDGDLPKAA